MTLPLGLSVTVLDGAGTRFPVPLAGVVAPEPAGQPAWQGVVEPDAGAPVTVRVDVIGVGTNDSAARLTDIAATPAGLRLRVTARADVAAVDMNLLVEASVPAADPWWLIPGLFYGENRPADCDRLFPRFEVGGADPAGLVSDHWSFSSDRAATPLPCVWGDDDGVGLGIDEQSGFGPTGVGLAHRDGVATVHVVAPYREDPVTYYGSAEAMPPLRQLHRLEPGAPAAFEVTVHALGTDRHAYAPILRERWESTAEGREPAAWVSVPEAADLTASGLLDWHYDPYPGVLLETVGFDRGIDFNGDHVDRQAMHIGWVSGIPWAYALLAHGLRAGEGPQVDAAVKVIDFCCAELSPSGTFWGTWYRGTGWTQSWTFIKRGLHARTLGEATHFLVRAVLAERAAGREHPTWLAALRSNLSVMAGRQRDDGNLGAIHHAETGEVLQWRGAAGLTWIPAFVEAVEAGLADGLDERWLTTAMRAGEHYAQYVDREYIHGAPEDVDLAPTSEDGYAAVMAYMALYRATGQEKWLGLARRSADWTLTFRYTYDVTFDPQTLLGVYGFATRGGDQASTSNQHLASYGLICTQELLDLSDALGDPYYAERALETLDCFRQFIARRDGDFNAYRGMVTERFYQTECFQPKGMLLTLSHAWCVGVTLLGCEQVLARELVAATV
ncbi:hypothetical protein [Xylanimonas protaetiae]|uniref:Uncharacterized protein n=1 Tax=Xylanimonas protaetiae TaxID=2509457 RepID=A0A4P6FDF7_9MICO|nr:hypothetical protein [Xylanimonas protaetiae]QAY71657.1 hypothetical protein ET471_17780 [Xylanimonas protaetiae]